jgi:dienelactone hydrolase
VKESRARPLIASVAGALVVLLAAAGASQAAVGPRLEGPFGSGSSQVWLLRPAGPIRSIVVFGHGWKQFPPSASHPWVGQFRPWLDHLARRGSAVLFPRYQLGTGDAQGAERANDYRRGVALGLRRLGRSSVPVVVVGYSYGASLAFTYAADARRWHLPQPRAVDCVFPAGPVSGVPLDPLGASIRVLLQVGDRDTEAGRSGADAFWSLLRGHPSARKRYQVVVSHAGFLADHAAPKGRDSAARQAFWAPLDKLVAAVT